MVVLPKHALCKPSSKTRRKSGTRLRVFSLPAQKSLAASAHRLAQLCCITDWPWIVLGSRVGLFSGEIQFWSQPGPIRRCVCVFSICVWRACWQNQCLFWKLRIKDPAVDFFENYGSFLKTTLIKWGGQSHVSIKLDKDITHPLTCTATTLILLESFETKRKFYFWIKKSEVIFGFYSYFSAQWG